MNSLGKWREPSCSDNSHCHSTPTILFTHTFSASVGSRVLNLQNARRRKTFEDCEIRTQIRSVCQDISKQRLRPTILKVFEQFSQVEISSRSWSDIKKYTLAWPESVAATHLSPSVAHVPSTLLPLICAKKSLCDQALNQAEELFLL